jgi:hypothetical protein
MPRGVETETGKPEYRTGEMQQKLEALGRDPIADMAKIAADETAGSAFA